MCVVDIGAAERLRIVCGAPNAAAGMKVPCATVGAQLPGGHRIARATMRGVESQGMLCSASELGIDADASGLLALPEDAVVGADLRAALGLDDSLITLKITPNRADCLSILGIARDVAAVTGAPLVPLADPPAPVASRAERAVRVEDADACPRFVSRIIEAIDATAPTPAWMKQRLERSGIRSISAVVDITNYVMLELGQPLHAYDDRLLDGAIVVRFARPGEKLTLLNEQVLDLEPDLLLVADAQKPLGLAGIMGGEHSGISDTTTTVLLEGAFWNPAVIQGKSRRLGFVSDAGYRFERGVDFAGCARAVERATRLILDCCGGRAGPLSDMQGALPTCAPIRVRTARVARLLGVALPAGNDRLALRPARLFVRARRRGFPGHAAVLPLRSRYRRGFRRGDCPPPRVRRHSCGRPRGMRRPCFPTPRPCARPWRSSERLVARGWQEAITFSFVSSAWESTLFPERDSRSAPIAVKNPIAAHLDVMRTTLAGGLLDVLRTNLARKHERVRVFEAGRCFWRAGQGYDQPVRLGGLAYGDALPEQWGCAARSVDLFDVKGDLEGLVAPRTLTTVRAEHALLHPGRAAGVLVDGSPVGWLGELHPRIVKEFELPRAPVLFELDLASLLTAGFRRLAPVSRLPVVRRDLAVVVADSAPGAGNPDRARRRQAGPRRHHQTVRCLPRPGNRTWQKKPCDSCAYAGY